MGLFFLLFCFTEKRSIKEQEVSGHIKLNISATIDGEEIRTPFHEQYTKLHEVMEREREREGEVITDDDFFFRSNFSSTATFTTRRSWYKYHQR